MEKIIPLVTVTMSAYNHEKYVEEAIEGIVNQTYGLKNIELIVIDDCSVDNTPYILESLSKKHGFSFIKNDVNKGLCFNKNRAISMAKGKYLAGCASDDIWEPEKLALQVAYMERNEACGVTFGKVTLIDNNGKIIIEKNEKQYRQRITLENFFRRQCYVPAPTLMFHTDLIKKTGGYREDIHVEDLYMLMKFAQFSEIHFIDEFLAKYRRHEGTIQNNRVKMVNSLKKIYAEYKDTPLFRKYKYFLNVFYAVKLLPTHKILATKYFLSGMPGLWQYYNIKHKRKS